MRAPVNMILTAMACCDTVVLFSNLVYTTHYKYVAYEYCTPANWSYGWVMFLIAHAHLSLIGHSTSLWLSVMLAFLRYMTLRNRTGSLSQKIGLKHSYIAIASVIIFVTVLNGPNFLIYKIREDKLNESCVVRDQRYIDEPAYIPDQSDLAKQDNCLLLRLAVWISGVVFKVVPCVMLTIFICLLMKILNEVKKNRIRLALNNHCDSGTSSFSLPSNQLTKTPRFEKVFFHQVKAKIFSANFSGHCPTATTTHLKTNDRTDRTTRMLLAIVIVFLLTEIPQGILAILLGVFSDDFRYKIYMKIGDILDLLSLCNACTTFIIYCSMSGQFRSEFQRVFLPFLSLFPPATAARRSSEGATVSKLCSMKLEDAENGCTGRERSATMRSAISVPGYSYTKDNGHFTPDELAFSFTIPHSLFCIRMDL
ncbi:unnamed protein product [Enterobius vermicularis]|uniref:G_PROTEIN_RECEP_F1_2 domain-containing protein n=1 Tax=Enterobius vermicularis TaxID=51028 RepID=A0A0N4VAW9_ENTVE|nr:unnamed protein product [Enterobius vermicularis]